MASWWDPIAADDPEFRAWYTGQLEDVLTQLQASGAVDTTPGIDGYFLDQANVSVSKSTPYIQMTQNDTVSLDNAGGATHHLPPFHPVQSGIKEAGDSV